MERHCAIGIATGVFCLHAHNIWHGELNSSNIPLDTDLRPQLPTCTWSVLAQDARAKPDVCTIGTPRYRAPEVWTDENDDSSAVDVYAYACTLDELLTFVPFWDKLTDFKISRAVARRAAAAARPHPACPSHFD
jgi:serine/threonine protein kinase